MKCSNCGTENRVGARNCKQCGQPLPISAPSAPTAVPAPVPPPGLSVCPNCGMSLKPGTRFCTRCGTDISAVLSNPPPTNYAPTAAPPPYPGAPAEPPQPRLVQPPVQIPQSSATDTAASASPTAPASPKKSGFRVSKGLVFAGIAALLLCVTLAVLLVVFRPWEILKPDPTATPTLTPTVTPDPTQTPMPTATPTVEPVVEDSIQIRFVDPPVSVLAPSEATTATLTVGITNTTAMTLTGVVCEVSGYWNPYIVIESPVQTVGDIPPNGVSRCVFTILGGTKGEARLVVFVTAIEWLDLKQTDEILITVE